MKELDFDDVKDTIKDNLKSKGVVLSPDGLKVEVVINNFQLWGNGIGKQYVTNGISDGLADAVGAGLVTRVIGGLIENKAVNSTREKKDVVCDASSCAPEVGFSIISSGYQANVDLRVTAPYLNYYSGTESMLENTISEFFEPTK